MSLAALMKKGGLRSLATATVATLATAPPPTAPPVATVAAVAVATATDSAANDARADPAPAPDPDRYCWPHSTAMNTAEIDRFLARVEVLQRKDMGLNAAEALADAMVMRDRDGDDRRSCFECQHFRHRRKTCGNFSAAGGGQELGSDLAATLQRCPGFQPTRL